MSDLKHSVLDESALRATEVIIIAESFLDVCLTGKGQPIGFQLSTQEDLLLEAKEEGFPLTQKDIMNALVELAGRPPSVSAAAYATIRQQQRIQRIYLEELTGQWVCYPDALATRRAKILEALAFVYTIISAESVLKDVHISLDPKEIPTPSLRSKLHQAGISWDQLRSTVRSLAEIAPAGKHAALWALWHSHHDPKKVPYTSFQIPIDVINTTVRGEADREAKYKKRMKAAQRATLPASMRPMVSTPDSSGVRATIPDTSEQVAIYRKQSEDAALEEAVGMLLEAEEVGFRVPLIPRLSMVLKGLFQLEAQRLAPILKGDLTKYLNPEYTDRLGRALVLVQGDSADAQSCKARVEKAIVMREHRAIGRIRDFHRYLLQAAVHTPDGVIAGSEEAIDLLLEAGYAKRRESVYQKHAVISDKGRSLVTTMETFGVIPPHDPGAKPIYSQEEVIRIHDRLLRATSLAVKQQVLAQNALDAAKESVENANDVLHRFEVIFLGDGFKGLPSEGGEQG